MRRTSGWLLRNWFLLGLAAAGILAWLAPGLGARGGPLRPELTTRVGVALIFFMQGLIIPPAALRRGALRWRLHLAIQLFIFAAFPLAVLAVDALAGRLLPPDLRFGFLFLAILPTTISGCVVYTARAHGDTPVAVFNAAAANIIGVAVTPLWASLILQVRGESLALAPVIGEVALLLLAPLLLGQGVRPALLRSYEPSPAAVQTVANLIILFIVFAAFSGSAQSGAFAAAGLTATLLASAAAGVLFAAATAGAFAAGAALRLETGARTALVFCGSQKTLAAGAPMAQVLFAGYPGLGVVLLPLMIYHTVQLVAGATVADRLARRRPPAASPPPARL